MIDLHTHVLPDIDDGPSTLAGSLELARAAVLAGTTDVVATPHVSWDYPGTTAAGIADATAALRDALAEAEIPLRLHTGAEVAMTRVMELADEELVALRLGGPEGTHLLVECPLAPTAAGFEQVLGVLRGRGHRILLAHPERCPAFQRDPASYERLVAQGMLGQVTAGSLVGRFGATVQRFGQRLVHEGHAQVIASDTHSALRRPPGIRPELEQAGLGAQADWLGRAVPAAILAGTPIPPAPAMPPARRSGLARLLRRA